MGDTILGRERLIAEVLRIEGGRPDMPVFEAGRRRGNLQRMPSSVIRLEPSPRQKAFDRRGLMLTRSRTSTGAPRVGQRDKRMRDTSPLNRSRSARSCGRCLPARTVGAMLLTLSTSGAGAEDLSYLLHKHPQKVQSYDLSMGQAHVFYPSVSADSVTAALLLDLDPVGLVRQRRGPAGEGGLLDQYVNDRPYVASSFLSVAIAREHHVLPVAIVFDLPEDVCHERNRQRPDRGFGRHVVRNQKSALRRALRGLGREGFRHVFTFRTEGDVESAVVERQPLWNNRRGEHGPFDTIGDVHGCAAELEALLAELGYVVQNMERTDGLGVTVTPPAGRRAVFLGDLVDRGPDVPRVLRIAMSMVADGVAWCVPGNHDVKLVRALRGKAVQLTHGLDRSLAQLEAEREAFRHAVAGFLDGPVSHYAFDDGKLVVAHAGLKESMQGRGSGKVREFCLFGETTGETDEFGLPVRINWAAEYRGAAAVVYGHTPVPEALWLNNTINIDTGCVFGGRLTALRYPERQIVSVPARATYAEPRRPFLCEPGIAERSPQQVVDDVLDLSDVMGKRIIDTPLLPSITIREGNAAAALEVMSRFAANPRWLIYLPPTMSPCETSTRDGYLEHPADAFAYYRNEGVPAVVCEQKHMGSRAVVVVCRDEAAACTRFGVEGEEAALAGVVYTRTGRRFFSDAALEAKLLQHVRDAVTAANLWDALQTNWLCLDCELMPWSAKAQELLRTQYAAVGSAGTHALAAASTALAGAAERLPEAAALAAAFAQRRANLDRFVAAYRGYCWPVESLADLRLAPFHLLASEGAVHADKPHAWHLDVAQRLVHAAGAPPLFATEHVVVEVTDERSLTAGVAWWEQLTERGGEGMVAKPAEFTPGRGRRGLTQPAVKCRGREYLRIIYGPQYDHPDHLTRLRQRGLGRKRSLAVREFALGLEGLHRFVRREPLRRVHECVFAVLALESEPVDPRL